jgi:acyl carrier protein
MFVRRFGFSPTDLQASYFDGVVANSIDALELLLEIEEKFRIQIDDDDLGVELISSVSEVAKYVFSRMPDRS